MSALAHLVIAGRDTALWLSAVTLARAASGWLLGTAAMKGSS